MRAESTGANGEFSKREDGKGHPMGVYYDPVMGEVKRAFSDWLCGDDQPKKGGSGRRPRLCKE